MGTGNRLIEAMDLAEQEGMDLTEAIEKIERIKKENPHKGNTHGNIQRNRRSGWRASAEGDKQG